jgi:hypothetical protein
LSLVSTSWTSGQRAADAPKWWRQDRAADGDEKFYLLRSIAERQIII